MAVNGVQERVITPDAATLPNPPSGKYWDGYDNTGYWIKFNNGSIIRPDIGTGINWTEDNTVLIAGGAGSTGAWTQINLGVGFEDALVEILIEGQGNNNDIGVRTVGSTVGNRFADTDNDSSVTMSVRADASGDIEYYQQNNAAIFRIIARWQ